MSRSSFIARVASAVLLLTAGIATDAAAQGFVVRDVRLFDGDRAVDATDVVVRDGLIAAVGRGLVVPADTPVVDGHGKTLLPALIDAHVHAYGPALRDALRFGVDTELDMFSDWHQLAEARRVRGSVTTTTPLVADLWSAGTLATVPHGHGTEYGFPIPTLTRPDEAAAFVAARIAEGSDWIKIIMEDGSAYGHPLPTLDQPTVVALVAAAHAAHRMAIAHVATEAEATEAIEAGIDGLAHVFIDRPASPAFVALAKQSGVFVVATLSVAAGASGADTGAKLADDPRLKPWISDGQNTSLRSVFPSGWQKRAFLTNAEESIRRLHAAGVPVLAGTDAGNPATAHGVSLHGELALLVDSGLTPIEALRAATALPARRFSLADRGLVKPGLRADLLLVDGDPTTDVTATRSIVAIWKNGVPVDRTLAAADKPAAERAPTAPDTLISDFDAGDLKVSFGQTWVVTTDAMAGGGSTATEVWQANGADGSKGAMHVQGTIAGSLPYAWAGTLFMPGAQPFAAVDFSRRKTLVFKVRGPQRMLSAMIFSGAATQRMPATVEFPVTPGWTEVRLPLAGFGGADPARVRGIAITAGVPAGPFEFDLDDVRVE
jgi:imidazolonepropionase-like amidohydrolase